MRKPALVLLGLALPTLGASPVFANLEIRWPPTLEVSAFGLAFEPRTGGLDLQPGFHITLDNAPGFGAAFTAYWNDTLSTRFTASYTRPEIRLSGSAGGSMGGNIMGGDIELVPLAALVQLRARRFVRVVPYAEAGLTYLLLPSSRVKPALAAAGIASLRRPDHIALITGAGLKIALKGAWSADLDVTYRPFAQSIFPVTRSGQVLKESTIDVHAAAIAGGFAYRF
jgi:outer membrane protein W